MYIHSDVRLHTSGRHHNPGWEILEVGFCSDSISFCCADGAYHGRSHHQGRTLQLEKIVEIGHFELDSFAGKDLRKSRNSDF